MIGYGNSMFLATTGILARGSGAIDPDAQAFITAASITDPTQQSAINQLVLDLKGYSIWTKFKAIYPIVGGTAATHKWNLKDPRDLDAAFRLTFASGWTHSSTGMTPLNAFADTFFNSSVNGQQNSQHISYYSRTNSNGTEIEIGGVDASSRYSFIEARTSGISYYAINQTTSFPTHSDSDSRAFYISNRTASNVINGWKNGVKLATGTAASSSTNVAYQLGALNNLVVPGNKFYSTKQCAFASIGDGLSDTEAANFYTAVQAFQVTLGRSIGTQTVSDADAQAFVNAANITDQVQANAINNLVIGMKADGLWTKMKAIYPVVGGVASSHAVNLKTPGTFNLTFASGWTHSSTGMTPANAYADTNFIPSINGTGLNNLHISYYSRTNSTSLGGEIGIYGPPYTLFFTRYNNTAYFGINGTYPQVTNTDSSGLILASRVNSTTATLYRNNNILLAAASTSTSAPAYQLTIGAIANANGVGVQYYTDRQCAFASIGDGLTDTDATNLYNRVNTFQTTLNRNV